MVKSAVSYEAATDVNAAHRRVNKSGGIGDYILK